MAQRRKVVESAQQYVNKKSYDYTGASGSGYTLRYGYIISFIGIPLYPTNAARAAALIAMGVTEKEIAKNASDEHADDKFFCSELVSRVFTLAGVPIVDGRATDQTPRQIRYSPYLQYLGHLIDKKEPKNDESYPSWQRAKIG